MKYLSAPMKLQHNQCLHVMIIINHKLNYNTNSTCSTPNDYVLNKVHTHDRCVCTHLPDMRKLSVGPIGSLLPPSCKWAELQPRSSAVERQESCWKPELVRKLPKL